MAFTSPVTLPYLIYVVSCLALKTLHYDSVGSYNGNNGEISQSRVSQEIKVADFNPRSAAATLIIKFKS